MGYILKLRCSGCSCVKTLNLGNGRKDYDSNIVAKNFCNGEILGIISADDKNWTFNWRLAQCKRCKGISRVPTITILDEQEREKVFAESTCECGCSDIYLFNDENAQQISCAECGKNYIIEHIGLWD